MGIGCSGYALGRKWFSDPQITGRKSRRAGGTSIAYENCNEATPFWSGSKSGSITIFGEKANPILENKLQVAAGGTAGGTYTVTLPAGAGEDDEEEEDVEEVLEALEVIESVDDLPVAASEAASTGDEDA